MLNFIDSTRIWDSNPFPGMIRLQGGDYSNEGRVEVYCNGQWGTICSTGFGSTDANTICKQLGYDSYYSIQYSSSYVRYSFDLFIIFCTCIDIPIPVSLYGVLICIVHQVIGALVVVTVAHPVQSLAVIITMMSLLFVVSALTLVTGTFLGLYLAFLCKNSQF